MWLVWLCMHHLLYLRTHSALKFSRCKVTAGCKPLQLLLEIYIIILRYKKTFIKISNYYLVNRFQVIKTASFNRRRNWVLKETIGFSSVPVKGSDKLCMLNNGYPPAGYLHTPPPVVVTFSYQKKAAVYRNACDAAILKRSKALCYLPGLQSSM